MIKIQDLLTTYWSQVLILIGVVSYFGKRNFDLISKKKESVHSVLQQNRTAAIKMYFSAFAKVELVYNNFNGYDWINCKRNCGEFNSTVKSELNELRSVQLELQLYLTAKEWGYLQAINTTVNVMNTLVQSKIMLGVDDDKYYTEISRFNSEVKELLAQCNKMLTECIDLVKYSYYKN